MQNEKLKERQIFMSRRVIVLPDQVRRARRDARFVAALNQRVRDADWRTRGRCLQVDAEVFFPVESPAEAVAICQSCVVRSACLAAALDAGDVDGVWGATTPEERRPMRQIWNSKRLRNAAVVPAAHSSAVKVGASG